MSFIEQAYLEIKTIDPSITATEFSTKWLNKCSSYYRSYKVSVVRVFGTKVGLN